MNFVKSSQVAAFGVFVAMLAMMAGPASAVGLDVTTAITGITDAGTAILSIIGALLALSVSIFGLSKAYAFVKRKAGA